MPLLKLARKSNVCLAVAFDATDPDATDNVLPDLAAVCDPKTTAGLISIFGIEGLEGAGAVAIALTARPMKLVLLGGGRGGRALPTLFLLTFASAFRS